MIEQIRNKAQELLSSGSVDCVIGYERATDGLTARPLFVYQPEDVERLIFDKTCTHNLTRYLRDKKDKAVAIVAKPCDARAINLLLSEKQIQRDRVFIIGVVCSGIVESRWGQASETLQDYCQTCREHTPPIYDFLVGETAVEELPADAYADVTEIEEESLAERRSFWVNQFSRCIRCYACRQACPGCYCFAQCFVEQLDPQWVGIRVSPGENEVWHTIRAFHLAGRCISCNECERVCPVDIPLSLLNRKLEKDVLQLFGFRTGMSADAVPPFAVYKKEERLGIAE